MKKTLLYLISAAFLSGMPAGMYAQDAEKGNLDLCYATKDAGKFSGFAIQGTGKTDVAISIPAEYAGAQITGMKIPVSKKFGSECMENLTGWVSTRLNGSSSVPFEPNLGKVSCTQSIQGDDSLSEQEYDDYEYFALTFDSPITVPVGGGYVGYSFDVEELPKVNGNVKTQYSIMAQLIGGPAGAFFMHYIPSGSNGGYSMAWTDLGTTYRCVSLIEVNLTDVAGNAIRFNPASNPIRIEKGTAATIEIPMDNIGYNGIRNIKYDLDFNGYVTPCSLDIPEDEAFAIGGVSGATYVMKTEVPSGLSQASYPYTITVKEVNGKDVSSQNISASNYVKVYDQLPVKRPLIEENTGTKCPYCTRGFYALEVMKRLYPDMIAISYHNSWQGTDPMSVISPPYNATGNPNARCDRSLDWGDFPDDRKTAGMEALYLAGFENPTGADISVSAEWTDELKTVLKATAKVNFPLPEEARYRLDIALIEDGMKGTSAAWTQSNGYAGYDLYSEPEWEKFNKSSSLRGLVFDDIFVGGASSNMRGVLGSLPTDIEAGKDYEYSYEFKVKELLNESKQTIVQDVNKLKVVAMLIQTPENVVSNAAQCFAPGFTGIGENGIVETVYPVAYYDLTGRQITDPSNGIYIVRMSDGTTCKRVIR